MKIGIMGLGLPGGGTQPWLYNFGYDLVSDPPEIYFSSRQAGSFEWEFHSTTTFPGEGNGNIATGGGAAVVAGLNSLTVDLSLYPAETGYLFVYVKNGSKRSNIARTPQFTTAGSPPGGIIVDEGASTGVTFSNITVSSVNYRLAVMTNGGQLVVTQDGPAEWEVIASGGAGGNTRAGGGGAGKRKTGSGTLTAATYTAVVGAGVAGRGTQGQGANGNDSSFNGLVAVGGGGGGHSLSNVAQVGSNGGHGGGGGGGNSGTGNPAGGTSTDGGNAGGNGYRDATPSNRAGGGGGGEGAAGGNGAIPLGGNAGARVQSDFDGVLTWVCGGGVGAGTTPGTAATGAGGPGWGGDGVLTGTSGAGIAGRVLVRWAI